jgi:hypothetical protein
MLVPAPASFSSILEALARKGHDAHELTMCLLVYLDNNKVVVGQHEMHDGLQAHTYREVILDFAKLLIQEMPEEARAGFGLIIEGFI